MAENETIICSFCGRNKQDTNILIAGSEAHICDSCIEQAHEIVKEDAEDEVFLAEGFTLLKPKEIKTHLDDFVIGLMILEDHIFMLKLREFIPSVNPKCNFL